MRQVCQTHEAGITSDVAKLTKVTVPEPTTYSDPWTTTDDDPDVLLPPSMIAGLTAAEKRELAVQAGMLPVEAKKMTVADLNVFLLGRAGGHPMWDTIDARITV